MDREPALEAAISADPDERSGYEVYADWLAERGDPRGEFIQVQLALELAEDPALRERERELLKAHEADWLGHLDWLVRVRARWRRGFVERIEVLTAYQSTEPAQAWTLLAELPSLIAVREAELGVGLSHHGRPPDDISLLEALRDHPAATLRTILFSAFDDQLAWTHIGDISIANAALANIEAMTVTAGRITLGAIDLPRLRRLALICGGLNAHVPASIATARWPALEELTVYFGREEYGGDCTLASALPLLAGNNLPRVTSLGLANSEFGDGLAQAIPDAAILPRLRRLDLSLGTMGDEGGRALLAHADRLAHLEVLDLGENYLSAEVAREIVARLPQARVADQKIEDEYGRYTSIGE